MMACHTKLGLYSHINHAKFVFSNQRNQSFNGHLRIENYNSVTAESCLEESYIFNKCCTRHLSLRSVGFSLIFLILKSYL